MSISWKQGFMTDFGWGDRPKSQNGFSLAGKVNGKMCVLRGLHHNYFP